MTTSAGPALPSISPLAAGAAALRRFWRPFLLIQLGAVALALAYRSSPGFRAACATAAAGWKSSGGLPIAAGELRDCGRHPSRDRQAARAGPRALAGRARDIVFNTASSPSTESSSTVCIGARPRLFGGRGAAHRGREGRLRSVRLHALLVGRSSCCSCGGSAASGGGDLPALRRGLYRERVIPLLLPNWLFWIPMVSVIYALPVALQFLMFIPALGAWSLIMVFIADRRVRAAARTWWAGPEQLTFKETPSLGCLCWRSGTCGSVSVCLGSSRFVVSGLRRARRRQGVRSISPDSRPTRRRVLTRPACCPLRGDGAATSGRSGGARARPIRTVRGRRGAGQPNGCCFSANRMGVAARGHQRQRRRDRRWQRSARARRALWVRSVHRRRRQQRRERGQLGRCGRLSVIPRRQRPDLSPGGAGPGLRAFGGMLVSEQGWTVTPSPKRRLAGGPHRRPAPSPLIATSTWTEVAQLASSAR